MTLRKKVATAVGALGVLLGVASTASAEVKEIGVGTLAPQDSEWGKVFKAWAKNLEKKTDGALTMKWYFNGQQGDENAMVDKLISQQLDGAAVTSVGLAKIHQDFLAVQMPGLCSSWSCIDDVRDAVKDQLAAKATEKGVTVAGWGDVGLAHTYSKGIAIKSPGDLGKDNGAKVYGWADDPTVNIVSTELGYTPVLKSVPTLLLALSSDEVNVATVPSLPAEQLQWMPHFDHVGENVAGAAIGGLIFSDKTLEGLSGDMKDVLLDTGEKAGKLLTKRIRKHDEKAYERAKKKMTVVTLSKAQKTRWKNMFKRIRKKLAQQVYPKDLVKQLESAAGK
jgi:TRAP-type C4-dicarboxylate transport system substrate-binding protein